MSAAPVPTRAECWHRAAAIAAELAGRMDRHPGHPVLTEAARESLALAQLLATLAAAPADVAGEPDHY